MKSFFAIDSITPWLLCSAVAHGILVAELPWNHQSPEIAVSSGSSPLHVSLVTALPTPVNTVSEENIATSKVIPQESLVKVQQEPPAQQRTPSVKEMPTSHQTVQQSALTSATIITIADSKHAVTIPKNDSALLSASKPKSEKKQHPQPRLVKKELDIAKTDTEIGKQEKSVSAPPEKAKTKPVKPKLIAQKNLPQLALAESSSYSKSVEREDVVKNYEEIEKTPQPIDPDNQDSQQLVQTLGTAASSPSRGGQQSPGKEFFLREAKGALQLALGNSFSYPKKARKRNWQGEVLLQVNVLADGKIGTIELLESSGYGLLDRNAIRSIESIGQLVVSKLDQELQIQIPVSYQLTDR